MADTHFRSGCTDIAFWIGQGKFAGNYEFLFRVWLSGEVGLYEHHKIYRTIATASISEMRVINPYHFTLLNTSIQDF